MTIRRAVLPAATPALILATLGLAAVPVGAQEVREGTLAASDPVFDDADGRVADAYTFSAEAGQFVTVALRSGEFDTFLRVVSPAGVVRENDDSGSGTDSRLSFLLDETGEWTVYAAAYGADAFGSYVVTWTATPAGDSRTHPGRLSRQTPKGQPYDSATFDLGAGNVLFQVSNADEAFLTLSAVGPDGRRRDGTPDLGATTLEARGAPAGLWTVWVAGGPGGDEFTGVEYLAYTLTAVVSEGGAAREIRGRLEDGDSELPLGEYADLVEIDVDGAGEVFIELQSADFDTFLAVETAGGAPLVRRNDDADGSLDASAVTFSAEEVAGRTGTWKIWVTSFSGGETGDYVLRVVR